jgi:hypothetical protein
VRWALGTKRGNPEQPFPSPLAVAPGLADFLKAYSFLAFWPFFCEPTIACVSTWMVVLDYRLASSYQFTTRFLGRFSMIPCSLSCSRDPDPPFRERPSFGGGAAHSPLWQPGQRVGSWYAPESNQLNQQGGVVMSRSRSKQRAGLLATAVALMALSGCGESTEIALAKVPPVNPGSTTPNRQGGQARTIVSPDVLPGQSQ